MSGSTRLIRQYAPCYYHHESDPETGYAIISDWVTDGWYDTLVEAQARADSWPVDDKQVHVRLVHPDNPRVVYNLTTPAPYSDPRALDHPGNATEAALAIADLLRFAHGDDRVNPRRVVYDLVEADLIARAPLQPDQELSDGTQMWSIGSAKVVSTPRDREFLHVITPHVFAPDRGYISFDNLVEAQKFADAVLTALARVRDTYRDRRA